MLRSRRFPSCTFRLQMVLGCSNLNSLHAGQRTRTLAVKLALAALGLLALLASGISSTDLKAQSYSCANSGAVANPGDNPLLVQDCTTLVTTRDTLAGNVQLNWSANLPIEQWEGVTVEGSPLRVVEIRLDGRYLSGRIPPELGSLTGLRVLSFRIDFLTGEIPVELTSLPELRVLDLHGNPLTGSIPPEIGRLSKLETLDLFANDLDGVIPGEMGEMTSLKRLDLGGGRLSGTIPRQLGNLKNLTVLHISHTSLTGEIPPELEGLRNLEGLNLRANELTGNIPPELGNLPNLFSLNLQSNELTGEIPNTLTGLSNLNGLYLGENEPNRRNPCRDFRSNQSAVPGSSPQPTYRRHPAWSWGPPDTAQLVPFQQ